ncbi:MAG: phosphoglycerate dehydrogenase [Polyangiaceae bacterium]|nr:phosphoglycerate dehydrogenase [Polyangiaceae bacterium]MCW5791606.1 phosphoglycerate dehydrogenase [Polyangiaceae bacterium]
MAKVLVSDSLSKQGLQVLEEAAGIECDYKPGLGEDELAAIIGQYEGLVIRSGSKVTKKVLAAAENLRVVGRAGIGVDNVDVKEASRRGVVVMNTPTGNAVTTAEHALALLLSLARNVPQASASMKTGAWEKKAFEGRELTGKTVGVIGLGNIGRIFAERALGLKMNVIAYDPVVTSERAAELGVELVSLDELFRRSDAISCHTPLTAETKHLVNDEAIAKMKDGVLLVNAARGGVYEEAALVRGLDSGKVGGVALDVFPEEPPGLSEIVKHPKAVVTPHLGASTKEAQLRVAVEIAQQVVAYLTEGTVTNSVNVPSVPREMATVLGPYVTLAERLGRFLGQVESISPRSVELEFGGEVANLKLAPVVNAALSGMLAQFLEEPVNPVNAPTVAIDRGIDVRELKSTAKGGFSSVVTLTVADAEGQRVSVAGTLASDRGPRLVRWGDLHLDVQLEGALLVMKNADKPGVIGNIGTILGESGINISRMQVGLHRASEQAASLWQLDSELPEDTLEKIRAVAYVKQASKVVLS